MLRNYGLSTGSIRPCNKEQKNLWIWEQKTTATAINVPRRNKWKVSVPVGSEQPVEKGETWHSCQSLWLHQGSFLIWVVDTHVLSPSSHSRPSPARFFLGETPGTSHQIGSQIIQTTSKKPGHYSQDVDSVWSCLQSQFPRQQGTTKRTAKEAEFTLFLLPLISSGQEGVRDSDLGYKVEQGSRKSGIVSPRYPAVCNLGSYNHAQDS